MIPEAEAQAFARDWIASWDAHALDRILAHYSDEIEYRSVFSSNLGLSNDVRLCCKERLREYSARGLKAYPDWVFDLLEVFFGLRNIVLRYRSVNGLTAAEVFEFDARGLVVRVQCHYDRA